VTGRKVAAIATAVLEDLNIMSREQPQNIIDRSKIEREVAKNRKSVRTKEAVNTLKPRSIYFDGKKDQLL
jgi:hypothetical protein